MARMERNAPVLLLGAALVASAVLTLVLTAHLTFFGDCWEFLMNRRSFTADALLKPHSEHFVVFPVLITQACLRIFGMTSARPEFVILTIGLLATATLLYVYVQRRVGPWLALFAALLLLFLGPAFEVLLWTFEITYVGSILFGIAMLLALERGDRRGDVAACVFLILSFGFSSIGIPFAVAAAVAVLVGPRQSWRRRAFVVAIPLVLYALWYVGWGHDAESHLSVHNVLASPRYVAEAMAAAVGSVFGLGPSPAGGSTDPVWGRSILILLAAIFGYRQYRKPGVPAGFWPVAAAALTNWFLAAFNEIPGREPIASRYQYIGAIFVLMMLANLLKDVRVGRRALLVAAAVTVLAVATNLVVLKQGKDFFQEQTVLARSNTAAIEIARRTVAPEFALTPEVAGTTVMVDVNAEKYLAAVDEYGSPAYSEAELAAAPEPGRKQADIVLGQALPVSTVTTPGAYYRGADRSQCQQAGSGSGAELAVPQGQTRIEVAPGPPAAFSLRRFAVGEYPVATEGAPGDSGTVLRIPKDTSSQQWYLSVAASQPVFVCPEPG